MDCGNALPNCALGVSLGTWSPRRRLVTGGTIGLRELEQCRALPDHHPAMPDGLMQLFSDLIRVGGANLVRVGRHAAKTPHFKWGFSRYVHAISYSSLAQISTP